MQRPSVLRILLATGLVLALLILGAIARQVSAYLRQPRRPAVARASVVLGQHPAPGCWELHGSKWNSLVQVPERVRFDTAAFGWSADAVALRLTVEPTHGITSLGAISWAPYSDPNRVYVEWGNGLGGVSSRLTIHGDSLSGTAIGWYDIGGPFVAGKILGVRGNCPRDSVLPWRFTG